MRGLVNPNVTALVQLTPDSINQYDCRVFPRSTPYEVRPQSTDQYRLLPGEDGNYTLAITGSGPTRAIEADNIEIESSASLCNACSSALGYLAGYTEKCQAEGKDDIQIPRNVQHHWNEMTLFLGASQGCNLCQIISDGSGKHGRLPPLSPEPKMKLELLWNTQDAKAWAADSSGDLRLLCAMTRNDLERSVDNYYSMIRLQLWPSPNFDSYFAHLSGSSSETERVEDERRPPHGDARSTSSALPLVARWLADCKNNVDGKHELCNLDGSEWRPSRLLDVQRAREEGRLYLISTPARRREGKPVGDYISLSHCWGEWGARELPSLKMANLHERQTLGIPIDELPKTFRDAVAIAAYIDVPYLWVDSLCIIQDSKEDWAEEVVKMCDVYSQAVLNISADSAVDARDGCFRDRYPGVIQPFKLRLKNLGREWWVAADESSLLESVLRAPIAFRAWVHQERHLSRRVVHFTDSEVFWECCAPAPYFASETFPGGAPYNRSFHGQMKLPVGSLLREAVDKIEGSAELRRLWDDMCEGSSLRALTNKQDKLPAMSGLAQRFGRMLRKDQYIAGFWRSSLLRGLFWSVDHAKSLPKASLTEPYIVPSWSWLSVGTRVAMKRGAFRYPVINIMDVENKVKPGDEYGSAEDVTLTVEGFVRKIAVITEEKGRDLEEEGGNEMDEISDFFQYLGRDKNRYLYVDGNLEQGSSIGMNVALHDEFHISPDYENETEIEAYHCLLFAVEPEDQKEDVELKGLLLEPTDRPSCFRRAGVASFYGKDYFGKSSAFQMRYRRKTVARDPFEQETGLCRKSSEIQGVSSESETETPDRNAPEENRRRSLEPDSPLLSLYAFDKDVDTDIWERLEPVTIKLI